jgi:hypothetical protein
MLRQVPTIVENPNAKDFVYKGGNIKFQDVSFRHLMREIKDG